MSVYDTPEKVEKRRQEVVQDIIKSGHIRYGGLKWQRLVALVGLSPSDMDYEPGWDDEFCPDYQ